MKNYFIIGVTLFFISCVNGKEVHNKNYCANKGYKDRVLKTLDKVIKSSNAEFPTSPYYTGVLSGCVGIAFDIDKNGFAKNIEVVKTSNRRFNKSAIKSIKQYVFEKSSTDFIDAYIVVDFDLRAN